jgi:tetratricopeptide (TPR) repeat protein
MDSITFIQPSVLERLESGQFVPERTGKSTSVVMQDRRDTLSPLAISKRCIRYEPQVFYHRKETVLELAKKINTPEHKIFLITGIQGIGKTSLVRGLVEMMGGGKEQVLWFDINVHTDFEEITQFLIQYIEYIAKSLGLAQSEQAPPSLFKNIPANMTGTERNALEKLSQSLQKLGNLPLMLVIDNVEFIVDPEYQIQSFSFKEILNFLLSYANIKMVMMGERMPYSDISVDSDIVYEVKLTHLNEREGVDSLRRGAEKEYAPEILQALYKQSAGLPWILNLQKRLENRGIGYDELMNMPLKPGTYFLDAMIEQILVQLSPSELALLCLNTQIRHPIDRKTLLSLLSIIFPSLPQEERHQLWNQLDKSLIRPFLKRSFPPQVVLKQVQQQLASQQALQPDPWFDIVHRQVKKYLYARLPEDQKVSIHQALQDLYLNDKNLPEEERLFKLKGKAMAAESTFHGQRAKKRRTGILGDTSLESRSYAYRSQTEVLPPSKPEASSGLDAYRNINVPDLTPNSLPTGQNDPKPFGQAAATKGPRPYIPPRSDQPVIPMDYEPPRETVEGSQPETSPTTPVNQPQANALNQFSYDTNDPVAGNLNAQSPSLPQESGAPSNDDPESEYDIQHALAEAIAHRNRPQMAARYLDLARYRLSSGKTQQAEECLNLSLTLGTDIPSWSLAEVYHLLSDLYRKTDREQSAFDALIKALKYYERSASLPVPQAASKGSEHPSQRAERVAEAYLEMAELYQQRGQPQESIRLHLQALQYFERGGLQHQFAGVAFRLGELYDQLNMTKSSLTYYEQALLVERQEEDHLACAVTLANLGSIHFEMGHNDRALRCFLESLAHDRMMNHREGQFKTLELIAKLYRQQHDWFLAEDAYLQSLNLAKLEGNPFWQATVNLNLGTLAAHQGLWKKALGYYLAAESVAGAKLSSQSRAMLQQKIQEAETHVHPNP